MLKRRTIFELLNEWDWLETFPRSRNALRMVPLLELPEFQEMDQETFLNAVMKNYSPNKYTETSSEKIPQFLFTEAILSILFPNTDLSHLYEFYFIDQTDVSKIPPDAFLDTDRDISVPYTKEFNIYKHNSDTPYKYFVDYPSNRGIYEHPCKVRCILKGIINRPHFLCYISFPAEKCYPCEIREWSIVGSKESLSTLNKEIAWILSETSKPPF